MTWGIAITPDGKTAYVTNTFPMSTVVPITTATNKVGKPIKVASGAEGIAITPDGKTAYVVSWSGHGHAHRRGREHGRTANSPGGCLTASCSRQTARPRT